jgi:DNA-binding transcriptional LysR family regulator
MDRLDLRLVEYFVAVAEELHFGRAAERLHIAQPSLSQQIRRLEQQLGVRLLERTSRNVQLTAAGEALCGEGRSILSQAQHAIATTRAAGAERLTVAFYGTPASSLLPAVLAAFGESHPSFEVSVRELLLGSVDEILDGTVDLAFTRLLPGQTDLEVEIIANEPRVAALPISHPLANRNSLALTELKDESFITNPAVGDDRAPPRWLAEQRRHGLPGRVACKASSVQEILALVASNRGISLVPTAVSQHYPRTDISYVPVSDADPAVISLARRPGRPWPAVEAFIEIARQVAAAALDPARI